MQVVFGAFSDTAPLQYSLLFQNAHQSAQNVFKFSKISTLALYDFKHKFYRSKAHVIYWLIYNKVSGIILKLFISTEKIGIDKC